MIAWLKSRGINWKTGLLAAMLAIPFGLYFATMAGSAGLVWLLLGLLGLTMFAALFSG